MKYINTPSLEIPKEAYGGIDYCVGQRAIESKRFRPHWSNWKPWINQASFWVHLNLNNNLKNVGLKTTQAGLNMAKPSGFDPAVG